MSAPWSKEFDQNEVELFDSSSKSIFSQNVDTFLNVVDPLCNFLGWLHFFIRNDNDVSLSVSKGHKD